MNRKFLKNTLAVSVLLALSPVAFSNNSIIDDKNESVQEESVKLDKIVLTAEEQAKQSLGVSIITAKELAELPVVNDVSEYIRRMPGVNLTGNSSTGQRGNNRQIDIRGMGPENTLILIDGKAVNSRNSVRYGWRGERDSRGDSNWVPADAIESIEVIRGPAAARYGSGAMGGVVNIKTKKVTNETHGSFEVFTNQPENSKEGSSHRESFNLSGPIVKDVLSYRIYGNYNKTDGDAEDINPIQTTNNMRAAGREGVVNKDLAGRLAWQINEQQSLLLDLSYGRQGNRFAGDSQNSNQDITNESNRLNSLLGTETNTMYRSGYALTHEGNWDWGTTKVIAQYDKTKNKRLTEGTGGSGEGSINSKTNRPVSVLDSYHLLAEANIPFTWGIPQVVTVGAEYVRDDFTDTANTQATPSTNNAAYVELPSNRSKLKNTISSVFVENNMQVTDSTDITLGLRFDDQNKSGSNWSPSLNITHQLNDNWSVKGGIARAYKAPNMYQSAEGYLLNTNGNGCPPDVSGNCILVGNGDLKPETSINKEIGFEYQKDIVKASLAWFRNDYKNKIVSGWTSIDTWQNGTNDKGEATYGNLLKWENTPEALIEGVEGSIALDWGNITWTNNVTYMHASEDKRTGNPLSIVPKYTINSIFHYQITDALDTNFVYTQYGRQEARQVSDTRNALSSTAAVKSYGLAGINFGYKLTSDITARVGISNLFDEKKERDNSINQTYNEPGRAYYASLKYQF